MSKDPAKKIPNAMKFVLGGSAGMMAQSIVHPLDFLKTRMQISKGEYKNFFHCYKKVVAKEGMMAPLAGISGSLMRQATYTTSRLGVYQYLNEQYRLKYERAPPFHATVLIGIAAGICGGFVATPADLGQVRLIADGKLPKKERRNYRHIFHALYRIMREEGVTGLWRGGVPTVNRSIVVNVTQLGSYSQIKNYLVTGPPQMEDNLLTQFCASMVAGIIVTTASMPLDVAKTRLQNQKVTSDKPEYRGMIHCIAKVAKYEGVGALWKGFTPGFLRLGPHTVLTLIFLEQLTKGYYRFVLGTEGGSSL